MNTAPQTILDRVIFRDGLVLIIDKPAGMPVHGGPGGGDHLELYFEALRFGLRQSPALGHRLDRDTSGCLALGRHPKGLRRLGRVFSDGLAEKTYWALVAGRPARDVGQIDAPLVKISSAKRGWRMVVDQAAGKAARTDYQLLASDGAVSWLAFRPHTGRTHQIRVHAATLGCPIIGDPVYGSGGEMMQLHARRLALPLYANKPKIIACAPPPPHMTGRLSALGWSLPAEKPLVAVPDR
jgi:tRNA pseudouridine32 synthase/23S rRNA pseudouridine746 synthase/23S rRNA pseudouridine1911/1915/1917 synthase